MIRFSKILFGTVLQIWGCSVLISVFLPGQYFKSEAAPYLWRFESPPSDYITVKSVSESVSQSVSICHFLSRIKTYQILSGTYQILSETYQILSGTYQILSETYQNLSETYQNLSETYQNLLKTYYKFIKTYWKLIKTYWNLIKTYWKLIKT